MLTLHKPQARGRRGFTLVELMVSVGLTAILMWGVLQLYSQATRFSATMFAEAELVAGGRAVLDRVCRELTSAATLDNGYLRIINDGTATAGHDMLQFVAPVGPDNELAHVRYHVDNTGMLCRSVLTPVETNNPSLVENAFPSPSPLGVALESMNIQYIDPDAGTSELRDASRTWRDENQTDPTVPRLPRAILIELRLADNKGTISIVLSSGAYLGGSGI
ncbi:MAG: prepilin-type N-terminal cleavage/methylation domain-containing protein [Planctomycetes bacterium]|nr:prepilin-type N-terminal cleavage/methylation domain-containing protein [Planctomycetota bacterium]